MAKLHIKKGDNVMVIAGNDKGRSGKVLAVVSSKNKAIIEGANMVSKHTKPNAEYPNGGIIKKEAGIHLSNLKVIDGAGNVTRIGRRRDESNGKSVRYSKKSGEALK